ncbi:unnamed protein product [Cylicocyclus nassatus]|uniref:TIL domain-containing protein n=1 Tax=Cylicocyclus nassatus TaxID=53992 RepID=A0AA36DI33_CYLNA|nr:unnamed protein product [Cylicocyclus nassatus]
MLKILESSRFSNTSLFSYQSSPLLRRVSIACLPGFHCEETPNGLRCVRDSAPALPNQWLCNSIKCSEVETCEIFSDGPRCISTHGLCAAIYCTKGKCVEYGNTFGCFDTNCGLHEEFKTCAACEQTCRHRQKTCASKCLPPSCQCIDGYLRHHGKCVPADNCKNLVALTRIWKKTLEVR